MSYKIYNRRNTQHRLNSVHTSGYMTLAVTRAGNIQISKAAVQYLGISAGDGVVLLEDEDFGDFYIGRGDVTHSAFCLVKSGKTERLSFACSDIAEILGKAAIAPLDWRWMVLLLFPAPDGKLGIDLKHPRFPKRPGGDTTAAREAKKRGRTAKEGAR